MISTRPRVSKRDGELAGTAGASGGRCACAALIVRLAADAFESRATALGAADDNADNADNNDENDENDDDNEQNEVGQVEATEATQGGDGEVVAEYAPLKLDPRFARAGDDAWLRAAWATALTARRRAERPV